MLKNIVVTALVAALVAGGVAWLVGGNQPVSFGGSSDSGYNATGNGVYAVDGTTVIDGSGNVDAPITSSTGTFTGDVGVGTTTALDNLHVEDASATTTLIISTGASAKGGRIILEDHDGAGCSEIAILNGTIASKTVTCPTGI
jgi:hypothetical protein